MTDLKQWSEQILDADYPRETLLLRITNSLKEVAIRCSEIASVYEYTVGTTPITDAILREFDLPQVEQGFDE